MNLTTTLFNHVKAVNFQVAVWQSLSSLLPAFRSTSMFHGKTMGDVLYRRLAKRKSKALCFVNPSALGAYSRTHCLISRCIS